VTAAAFVLALSACTEPATLDAELDRKLVSLRPGLSMADVAAVTSADAEMLVVRDRKVLVFVAAKSGQRLASIQLQCSVDQSERLEECSVATNRAHVQSVTQEQLVELRKGQALGAVVARLCAPEQLRAVPDGGTEIHYTTQAPPDWYLPWRPVVISFGKNGKLRKVEQPR
jgi:hypothetical protein